MCLISLQVCKEFRLGGFTAYLIHPFGNSAAYLQQLPEWRQNESVAPGTGCDQKKFGDRQTGLCHGANEALQGGGCESFGRMYTGIVTDPDLLCLYSFFNSNIGCADRNSYGAMTCLLMIRSRICHSVFQGYGDHVSLFTITAVLTSFLISIYNMSMTPTQDNPALKYMPYIFPFMLLFIFNKLPSALTWYYTVSNISYAGIAVCDTELYHQP
jgi:YidC/Oxa1 family membrane protein insertase